MDERAKVLTEATEVTVETLRVILDSLTRRYGSERAREILREAERASGLERRAFARPRRVVVPGACGRPPSLRTYAMP